MYSILSSDGEQKKRAKEVKKAVVKRVRQHQDYVDTLFRRQVKRHTMMSIRSRLHLLYTERLNVSTTLSLSPFDDKRWLLNDVESRARGHFLNIEERE